MSQPCPVSLHTLPLVSQGCEDHGLASMCGNTWWGWLIIKSVKKPGKKRCRTLLKKHSQTTFLVFKSFQRKQAVNPLFYINMIFPPCCDGLKISTQGRNSDKRVRVRSCLACLVQFGFFSARTTWKQECYNNQVKRLGQGRNELCYSYLHVNNPPCDSGQLWCVTHVKPIHSVPVRGYCLK